MSLPLNTDPLREAIIIHGFWHFLPGFEAVRRKSKVRSLHLPDEVRTCFARAALVMSANRGVASGRRLGDLYAGLEAVQRTIRSFYEACLSDMCRHDKRILENARVACDLIALLADPEQPLVSFDDRRFEMMVEDAGAPQIAVEVARVMALVRLARLAAIPGTGQDELRLFQRDVAQSATVLARDATLLLANILSVTRDRLRAATRGQGATMSQRDQNLRADAGFVLGWLLYPEIELDPIQRDRLEELQRQRHRFSKGREIGDEN